MCEGSTPSRPLKQIKYEPMLRHHNSLRYAKPNDPIAQRQVHR
jgi:hypothetical protein